MSDATSTLTGAGNYFEDFEIGAKLRHARGTTIGEIENQMLTKLVLNTADGHYNEHRMQSTQFGQRLVFGLVTGSVIRCTPIPKCSRSATQTAQMRASFDSNIGAPSRTGRSCSKASAPS